MEETAFDQEHTITVQMGRVVLYSMGWMSLRALVVEAMNEHSADEVRLYFGDVHIWDIEREELGSNFDYVLLSMLGDLNIRLDGNTELKTRLRLVVVSEKEAEA